MATFELELVCIVDSKGKVTGSGKTLGTKTMDIDTLNDAMRYACMWIDKRNGYYVNILKISGIHYKYITPVTYRDGTYYKGVFEKPINPNTGRPVRKTPKTKYNEFGLLKM